MKRVLLFLFVILLLFTSCEKACYPKHPKDLKPIDWENYNDVYTVYWNFSYPYSELNKIPLGEEIMICGWIYHPIHSEVSAKSFILLNDSTKIFSGHQNIQISVANYSGSSQLQRLFDTCDLTRKCFVKGKLDFSLIDAGICHNVYPEVVLLDTNKVYFE